MNYIGSKFKDVAEYFTPVLAASQFHDKGVLTPEEFVRAGDELVFKCKTWQWASGEEALRKPYLPNDKQFLITKNVPSLKRASDYELKNEKEMMVEMNNDGDEDDGWLETHVGRVSSNEVGDIDMMNQMPVQQLQNLQINENKFAAPDPLNSNDINNDEDDDEDVSDVPDIDDFDEDNLIEENEAVDTDTLKTQTGMLKAVEPEDNIIRTRTYDLSISYDKYYRTPRVYLFGYNEYRQPLTAQQIFEDISCEHAHKTVTVENHPHVSIPHASIHPCKHASVMKRIVEQLQEAHKEKHGDENVQFNIDQYMFLFLKFVSTVIPTINYDYTSQAAL